MPILDPAALKSALKRGDRLLGLDVGTKTIGLAISDPGLILASPLDVVQRTKFSKDVLTLEKLCEEWDIGGLVIGLPVNMDGTEGSRSQSIRQFGNNVLKYQGFSSQPLIAFWDERLSTAAVERFMVDELDLSRSKRQGDKDKLAAAWILQGFLDFCRNL